MIYYNLLIIIELSFLWLIFKHIKRDSVFIKEPVLFFILGSSFIYLIIPLIMSLFNLSWHGLIYKNESYLLANITSFMFILMSIFFYKLFIYFVKIPKEEYKSINPLLKKQIYILLFLFFIPIVADLFYLIKYINSFDLSYYLKNRIILRKGMGLVILISYMATILIPIFYTNIFIDGVKNKKTQFIMFLLITFVFIYAYSLMGNRLTIFALIAVIFLSYLYISGQRFSLFTYVKVSFILVVSLVFFTILGFARLKKVSIFEIDYQEFLNIMGVQIGHNIVKNFGNFEHLVWLIDNKNQWEVLYGKTYIAGFLNIVPRSIWPEKWFGGGPYLKNFIHPGSYDLSGSNITSYTTGMIVENFMNFGYFSIIIGSFFVALILFLLKLLSSKIEKSPILFIVYLYFTFSFAFMLMFGEFLGIYSRTLFVTIPFLILFFVTNKYRKRRIL